MGKRYVDSEGARWLMVCHIVGCFFCLLLALNNPEQWYVFLGLFLASAWLGHYWWGQIGEEP